MDNEDKDYQDIIDEGGGEYSQKSDFNKGEVVKGQMKKILDIRSKEMKDGFAQLWTNPKSGKIEKIDLPDPRQEFFGAVDALVFLLMPEIKRNETCSKAYNEFKTEKKKLFDEYAYKEISSRLDEKGNIVYTGKCYMPNKGNDVVVGFKKVKVDQNDRYSSWSIVEDLKSWDIQVNLYRDALIPLYDELCANLSILIDSINYFKQATGY